MQIDKGRVARYLYDISSNTKDIESLVTDYTESKIINEKHLLKSLKYSLVEISEAMSLVLQHILAKHYSIPAKGYVDTIKQAANAGIIPQKLSLSLKPFFDFRNSLVHRYWAVDDKILLNNSKAGITDFSAFVETIERFLERIQ
ncbi:MAG: HepT-like ribonuclease domain-containing protein [Planctomycetota bacterium]